MVRQLATTTMLSDVCDRVWPVFEMIKGRMRCHGKDVMLQTRLADLPCNSHGCVVMHVLEHNEIDQETLNVADSYEMLRQRKRKAALITLGVSSDDAPPPKVHTEEADASSEGAESNDEPPMEPPPWDPSLTEHWY